LLSLDAREGWLAFFHFELIEIAVQKSCLARPRAPVAAVAVLLLSLFFVVSVLLSSSSSAAASKHRAADELGRLR
jgi:N-methylhydantoinase B/oxoprolinase/acetone carboxylase alpha subunit